MSSMRSAAKGLVETRRERFESRHSMEESRRRLEQALPKARATRAVRFTPSWSQQDGATVLEVELAPPAKTGRLLKALSIAMFLLVVASAWAVMSPAASGPVAFLLPLFTVLAVLGFPFLVLALASNREAEEARLRKAIRVALQDEEERLPPQQKWDDED